ncbi:sigma-70 family RNA polymerase sigma factor [Peptococcaceae bacterium]
MNMITKQMYESWMVEHGQRFYRMAYSYMKNEQDALEVISEATYKGLKNLHRLREPDFFVTWMTRIIINTAVDELRRKKRVFPVAPTEMAFSETTASETIASMEENLQHYDLYEAIDLLTAEEKTCIILRYFEEYSFVEIAEILKLPQSTVKSRVYRCLKRMKLYMEEANADE